MEMQSQESKNVQESIRLWRNQIIQNSQNINKIGLQTNIVKVNQALINFNKKEKQVIKCIMFVWQVLNHTLLRKGIEQVMSCQNVIYKLIEQTFKVRMSSNNEWYHRSTLKCLLIFVYNLYLRIKSSSSIVPLRLMKVTLNGIFKLQKYRNIKITDEQQQWINWLLLLIFNWSNILGNIIYDRQKQENSDILQHRQLQYRLLQSMNDMMHSMIDARCTTQLVCGYPSPIKDICQMYNHKSQQAICISQNDLKFVCKRLKEEIQHFIKQIYQPNTNDNQKQSTDHQILILMDIICKITFLGGYNTYIQRLCQDLIIKPVLKLLEVTYLIYILKEHNIKNVHLSQNNQKLYSQSHINSLANLINQPSLRTEHINKIKDIPHNILPLTLRLLSNLVHINIAAQQYFQSEIKYFHIVLSLTHNTTTQMTMRQWAIIFIRHVSQCSPVLRQAIQKVELNINVKQNSNFQGFSTVEM